MRSGVRQRDHARRMPQERRHRRVVVLEQLRDELRVERQVEHVIERVLAGARRELGHRYAVALELRPVAVEQDAWLRPLEIFPEFFAKRWFPIDARASF